MIEEREEVEVEVQLKTVVEGEVGDFEDEMVSILNLDSKIDL